MKKVVFVAFYVYKTGLHGYNSFSITVQLMSQLEDKGDCDKLALINFLILQRVLMWPAISEKSQAREAAKATQRCEVQKSSFPNG